ncbi:MAG: hypothetical protein H7Z14_07655 [Anaerolineae bacterium]|nr:hypothetical protein [Phycisphaerae bacterium]
MSLHRALLGSIGAAMLVGVVGCETCTPPASHVYPGSKSSSHMKNTQWNVTGEEAPQAPAPEIPAQPATPPAPAEPAAPAK